MTVSGKSLTEKLGILDAEKFIIYSIREPFDYTKWQRDLFVVKSAKEISRDAMESKRVVSRQLSSVG